jgi:ribosomal protein S18 acetylase RimI-like enzyme
MRLRVATEQDVPVIVAIHLRAFDGFFLTSLGGRFLSVFYRFFVGRRDSVLTVVCDDDEVVAGFLAGVKEPSGFFARMRSTSGARLLCSALPALLRRPRVSMERLMAAVTYRGDRPPSMPDYWLLSSLAVDPSRAAKGCGALLVNDFMERSSAESARGVYLTTDLDDNDAVLAFYRKLGFKLHSRHGRSTGRQMALLVRRNFE